MADSDFVINNNVLTDYRGNERIISIPEGVTQIASYVFSRKFVIRSVTIPASTWRICAAAFSGCVNLEKVILPDSIRIIDDWAFENCYSLNEITIPIYLEVIGKRAFSGCSSLSLKKSINDNKSDDITSNDSDTIIYNDLEIRIQNGDTDAMYEMAQNYYIGKNNYKENYNMAAYWYYQAAIKDHVDSQYELGRLYETGLGVGKVDLLQALEWYEKAARKGNKNAACAENRIKVTLGRREKIDFKSIDMIFGEFDETVMNRYLKSPLNTPSKKIILTIKYYAYNGNKYAQYALGSLYDHKMLSSNPVYVMYGEEKADYWYTRSAELGYKRASEKLLGLNEGVQFQQHINGNTTFTANDKSAIENLLRSANDGNRIAQYQLARNFDHGMNGFNADDQKATEWFLKSATQDYMDAQYEMGRRYESGTGITQNYKEAFFWYSKAAAQGHTGAMTGAKRVKNKM